MISIRTQIIRVPLVLALVAGVLSSAHFSLVTPAHAQAFKADTTGDSAKLLDDLKRRIARGRGQLDGNQIIAVETLRAAALQSLNVLSAYIGPQILTAPPEEMPQTGIWAEAVRTSAEAHYWWGHAADQFGMRDEAITAFARATRFAGRARPNASDSLARDSLLGLNGTLRDGLPLVAPDDALVTVAEIAHGKLWTPRRFTFQLPSTAIHANQKFRLNPQAFTREREFLVTSGRVYPPVPTSAVNTGNLLWRVPPIYRTVAAEALPGVLRHDRMAIGYFKETSGPEKGLWRQAARVFYASSYLTRGRRDDRLRAEALCAQFLKVRALIENSMGLSNAYSRSGITNLWLSEVSALWPKDDDDPRVRFNVGVQMPKINTPTSGTQIENREIDVEPASYPWRAGARQNDGAPGDILFFQLTAPRDEAEWLRQMTHEYGHVSLPAIGGFKPPLEPFANGLIGETLGLMWAASAPAAWKLPAEFGVYADDAKFSQALSAHVTTQAVSSLRAWKSRGPLSPLRRDTTALGLQYLQGMAVYAERVYGADVLGAAFSPLLADEMKAFASSVKPRAITTESLMASFPAALSDPFSKNGVAPSGVLPIWLPGALGGVQISTEDFLARANLKMKAGEKVSGWLYVPARASVLHLEWKTALTAPNSLETDAGGKMNAVPAFSDANNAAGFDVKKRSGWQRLSFTARADLELVAAQFEK